MEAESVYQRTVENKDKVLEHQAGMNGNIAQGQHKPALERSASWNRGLDK